MPWHRNGNTTERGYGWQWQKLRKRILQRDSYLCRPCKDTGRYTPAKVVDHIIPKAEGGTDDPANLQCLCIEHEKQKTAQDAKRGQGSTYRHRTRIGISGWPE